jgi:hypothetical protein
MATPKPGQIRCPTCHRSTPPAAFCTQCGTAIPTDARVRPRGMDREELQDRIRARRSGGDPYRRGAMADDEHPAYERFEPEPEDERVQRERRAGDQRPDHLGPAGAAASPGGAAAGTSRGDLTREPDDWSAPRPDRPEADVEQGADAPAPPPHQEEPPAYDTAYDTAYDAELDSDDYPYDYDRYDDDRERSSGAGAFAILGFLALGVIALLGGAMLAGVFSDDPGVAEATATPVASASVGPGVSDAPSEAPASTAPSAAESPAAPASGEPVVFPDGFTAEAQPCLPGSAGGTGCNSNGATNGGALDIWVGFQNGSASDVIGATIIGPDGSTVSENTIPLDRIGCGQSCNGWTYFNFRNLTPGTYEVRVTRNGEFASGTSFEVS